MKRQILLTFLVLICGAAVAEEPVRSISVTGTSVTSILPDSITWSITISEEDMELAAARARNDEKLNAIVAVLDQLGLDREDYVTGTLSVRKEYDQNERGVRTTFRGFSVTRYVTVTQRDLARFDEFYSELLNHAEVEVSYSMSSSKIHEHRAENRLKATALAKEKAEAMCAVLGAELGPPITISEHGPDGPSAAFGRGFASNNGVMVVQGEDAADAASGTFSPGNIDVQTTVYVTFSLN